MAETLVIRLRAAPEAPASWLIVDANGARSGPAHSGPVADALALANGRRVLLLLPTTGYRNNDFLAAAKKLGVEIVAAANYCHQLAPSWGLAPIMALQ